ncbi:MAG: hypothetical protein PHW82_17075 [Bacteroidales bacterium]|nr:hypothetical protein [Bacteroidales bacterium]
MARKCIVNVHAEDGVYPKSFVKFENGLKYFQKQAGINFNADEVKQRIDNNGYFSVTDDWGRSIEITFREVGTCKVCKKGNSPLYNIRITPKMHKKVVDETVFGVCIDCADGYECGCWDVVQEGKRYIIVKDY